MPDTIADLARRLARLERRVTTLERARRTPYPEWSDLPLTGDTAVPDASQPPQVRANLWGTLDLSGRIALTEGRAVDGIAIALLPDGHRPRVPRSLPVASDAVRRVIHLDLSPKGAVTLRVPGGGSVKATWLGLDSASCRLDAES
ncbi:hypothetical protein [Streptomyces fractus]|uniref:hypothetical protein n=1 Tax=Streptomyces fractus TaxID=641806 RepID=UPI003CF6A629